MKINKNFIILLIIAISCSFIFTNVKGYYKNSVDTVTILTINDFHAHVEPYPSEYCEETGGMSLLSGYIDYYRNGRKDTVWTIAGDHFQGTPIDSLTKGEALIKLLNLDPPDVFCLGNHEFDYGKDTLLKRIEEANFPIICANLVYEETGEYFTKPYIIKDIDGVKTLFIGVICENLNSIIVKGNAEGLKVLPVKETVEKIAKKFVNDVDLTVVISHIGVNEDINLARNLSKESGVDVIVGGHSHTLINEAIVENGIIIVQSGSNGKYLGKLDLNINLEKNSVVNYKWQLIPVVKNENIKPNVEVDKLTQNYLYAVNIELNKEIGRVINNSLMPETELESALGNFSCDVPVKKMGIDIAFQNKGGLRSYISDDKGVIKIKNVWEVFPFDNYWVKFRITSKQLWTIIERNAQLSGEYLMIPYTLAYKFDSSRPKGNRVIDIWYKGKLVNPNENSYFECITNNYIWGHSEEIFGLTQNEIIKNGGYEEIIGISYRDIYIDYIKEKKIIYLSTEGRVIDINYKDIPFLFLNLESGIIQNNNSLIFEGYTEKNCKVLINNNMEIDPDDEGKFSVNIPLSEGKNEIFISAINKSLNKNERKLTVFLDTSPPNINILSFEDNSYTNNEKINLNGVVSDSLSGVDKLLINNEEVFFNENGEFNKDVKLLEGENKIIIEAIDKVGNKNQKILIIFLDKTPPEILVSLPEKTNEERIKISGKIKDNLSDVEIVKINGKIVNLLPDKSFSYDVKLLEGENKIIIEAIDKVGNQTQKILTITYIKKITLKLQIGNKTMYVNELPHEIDVPPTIIEGRTYLPIRWVTEPLGANLSWDQNEKKVRIELKETVIELWIGKNIARVNGIDTPIDPQNTRVVPLIINGRTMLPVRFVAENLGCKVEWEPITKTITITYPE